MKKFYTLITLLSLSLFTQAQIKGVVKDTQGNPIPYVNIYEENTYNTTTSNENGVFSIVLKSPSKSTIVFQYLGFKTAVKTINNPSDTNFLEVVMSEEEISLNEVVINTNENPANEIITTPIKNKKNHADKTARYTADFYSRGLFRIKNLPKTFLGEKIDMFDEIIDSTRSGILYLSETVSKITFQKPDKLKEVIIASKVSGKDNGFSFNSASSANFDFYDNYIDFGTNIVSPIANNAFSYYKYKFEGSFFTENRQQINKIKIIPIRENEPVMQGYIYIVDDSYAIYAVDITITGKQVKNPALNTFDLKQNYGYNGKHNIWTKNTQSLEFDAGLLGFNFSGGFTYVYSNFEFPESFAKRTFTAEVIRIEEEANKKDIAFWNTIRPVPLTEEESNDYTKKDALQEKKKSKVYLDSIDAKSNKFNITDLLSDYTYKNSHKNWSISYGGPLLKTSYNTVQGYNTEVSLTYTKSNEDKNTFYRFGGKVQYGFNDETFRPEGFFTAKLNNRNKIYVNLHGGNAATQFNNQEPISKLINAVSTLLFKDNYMKLYERNYAKAAISGEAFNGLHLFADVEYAERKPLFNTSFETLIKKQAPFTSNNPLLPYNEFTTAFTKHNLVKFNLSAQINFGQEFITRPDGKYNLGNSKFPTLILNYEKGFGSSNNNYHFDKVAARMLYTIPLANKGTIETNFKAGKFFNADHIAFMDYKHFNGNLTHVNLGSNYNNSFFNLPYYSASTNDSYLETHLNYNDKGFIMNKLPLLKHLQSNLILSYKNIAVPQRLPYHEFAVGLNNLGFGKYRLLRVDYVHSVSGTFKDNAIMVGINF
jgi:hypothetical protein